MPLNEAIPSPRISGTLGQSYFGPCFVVTVLQARLSKGCRQDARRLLVETEAHVKPLKGMVVTPPEGGGGSLMAEILFSSFVQKA